MTRAERDEERRLEACLQTIDENLTAISRRLRDYAQDVQESHDHMWEARRDMDHIDKAAMRQSIDQKMRSSDVLRAQQIKLQKLRKSPYFGRFDFARDDGRAVEPVYIGVHDFREDETGQPWVHDWRAPVSSLFYDFETGPAHYEAPSGRISGDMILKRQFRIRDSRMEFMLDTSVNIVDDVLQQELSRASDEGMKNIVATIQRDQNAIIRDAEAHTLIIQGVAGSGKTSIALHRIAFLLYRFKDTLTSSDILIISPNRVFADYIGNVLPELGEESVAEIGMEDLAHQLLGDRIRFQTFFEQTATLLDTNDTGMKDRIRAKSSPRFLQQIESYTRELEKKSFVGVDWKIRRRIVPAWFFEESWARFSQLPPNERISAVVKAAIDQIDLYYRYELRTGERQALRKAVKDMVNTTTLRQAYKGLFDWLNAPDLFKPKGGKLEYADVFPLIYLKMRLEGVDNPYSGIKHLLVDEMQDYTPVQYAVLSRLFDCRKTILGDATQAVNPYSASSPERIGEVLQSAVRVTLNKSYRSSWEIMQFALGIAPNPDLVAMERHGEAPRVVACTRPAEALDRIRAEIEAFEASEMTNLAIIAKTQKHAAKLQRDLEKAGLETRLLDDGSKNFSTGVLICTAHLAKGLEFDQVIVPDADADTYHTDMDRNLLYVACTRAMHKLTLIATGARSPLLPEPAAA